MQNSLNSSIDFKFLMLFNETVKKMAVRCQEATIQAYKIIPKKEACNLLGIKMTQLRVDISVLKGMDLPWFDYSPYSDRNLSQNSFECLSAYRKLVRQGGQKYAVSNLKNYLETYFRDNPVCYQPNILEDISNIILQLIEIQQKLLFAHAETKKEI